MEKIENINDSREWWHEKQCEVNNEWIDCYEKDRIYYKRHGDYYNKNEELKDVTRYSDKYDVFHDKINGGMRKRRSKKSKKSRKSRKSYKLKKKNVRRRKTVKRRKNIK